MQRTLVPISLSSSMSSSSSIHPFLRSHLTHAKTPSLARVCRAPHCFDYFLENTKLSYRTDPLCLCERFCRDMQTREREFGCWRERLYDGAMTMAMSLSRMALQPPVCPSTVIYSIVLARRANRSEISVAHTNTSIVHTRERRASHVCKCGTCRRALCAECRGHTAWSQSLTLSLSISSLTGN